MIRKAVIPAAGLGTRFLPATKAQPKEMLPIVDKPTIQYVVEEAIESGIQDILIITGRGKRSIEDHFDHAIELEWHLARKKDEETLREIKEISRMADIHYVRQREPLGLGHAILCARSFIGDEPFAVMLGDDIIVGEPPCLRQMIDRLHEYRASVIAVEEVPHETIGSYGCIKPRAVDEGLFAVEALVEKPDPAVAPSDFAIIGRYILTPEIFDFLAETKPGKGGEIQLTDGLQSLLRRQSIYGFRFKGRRHDVGDKFGYLKATVEMALDRPDLAPRFREYLKGIAGTL